MKAYIGTEDQRTIEGETYSGRLVYIPGVFLASHKQEEGEGRIEGDKAVLDKLEYLAGEEGITEVELTGDQERVVRDIKVRLEVVEDLEGAIGEQLGILFKGPPLK